MKPILSYYCGHDANLTLYDPQSEKYTIFEFEKIAGLKHYHSNTLRSTEENNFNFKKALQYIKQEYGIEEFDILIQKANRQKLPNLGDQGIETVQSIFTHHEAHSYCGYAQSNFDNAAVISYDGGGDDTCFLFSQIHDWEMIYQDKQPWQIGMMYNWVARPLSIISYNTDEVDLAGKLMGLSAYGSPRDKTLESVRLEGESERWIDIMLKASEAGMVRRAPDQEIDDQVLKEIDDRFGLRTPRVDDKHLQFKYAYAAQRAFEIEIKKYINLYRDKIRESGDNVILTGGCALNVLANEFVKREFPEITFYVPPNPHDGGLSFGALAATVKKRANITYAGPKLFDLDHMPKYILAYKPKVVTNSDIVSILREGKIVGLCQGRLEVGPRALGNRSILCDPSYPEMKDILNHKVKNREWFRPFAPVCRKQDAHIWFDSLHFNNMEAMGYVVDVKKQFRSELSSITHVDGTGRLQTVTEGSNQLLYNLLTEFNGVLLNTSFNLGGKPILNRIDDALYMLHNTGLDHVVVEYERKLYLFS